MSWDGVGEAAVDGLQAFVDGVIPFADPLENTFGLYDSSQNGLKYSQFSGGATRDLIGFIGGAGWGSAARAAGIQTTVGQRFIMAEFGPSSLGLLANVAVGGGSATTKGIYINYLIKTAERVDTGMKLK